jgi:hypothetical protein
MGYTKRTKRCIPREGMPHTHKACQKKEKNEKIAHTKKKYRRERNHAKEFLHHPPKISTHLYNLDQGF